MVGMLSHKTTTLAARYVFSTFHRNVKNRKWIIPRLPRRCLSTTSPLQETFKSLYTADMAEGYDFFSFMSKDIGRFQDKVALICGASGRSLTYKEVFDQAKQIGISLQQRGYRKGDMAAIFSPNIPEYVVTVLGCAYAGLSITLVNPLYQVGEVETQFRDTNTVVAFVFPTFVKSALAAKHAVPKVREIFIYGVPLKYTKMNSVIDMYMRLFHGDSVCFLYDELLESTKKKRSKPKAPWSPEAVKFEPSKDLFLLPYSSGTSGLPKATCHVHSTIIAYIEQLELCPLLQQFHGNNFLCVLPFFHIFGFCCSFIFMKKEGVCVTNPLFQKSMFLKSIQNYKLNVLPVVPPLVNFMATDPDAYTGRKYDLSSVKAIYSGGAPFSKELGEKFHEKYPNIMILQGYGMTEGMVSTTGDTKAPYDSIGKLVGNVELKIIEPESREECGRNEPGEFRVKTPSAFIGYLNNPTATKESFHFDEDGNKWLCTGDIGYIDDNDNIFIVDRLKELLKYKGHQVSPVEVEEVLITMPEVADCAVAGVPHELFGDLPMAFVVKEKGSSSLSEEEVEAYIHDRMAFQNHLRGGVIFLDEIPKSRIGKILRGQLRTLVKEKMASGEIKPKQ